MGLAGPRKRTKINHDPNNTAWSRSVGFGHNFLLSQGWQPGQTLGAHNAPHAHTYTAGSSSHVRAFLRQENLGLGATGAGERNGTNSMGLDALQGILGRLNGKSDEVLEKEQRARQDVKARLYAEGKWGGLRFVQGGTLHGNEISSLVPLQPGKGRSGKVDPGNRDEVESKESIRAAKRARKEEKRRKKAEKAQRKVERARKKAATVAALTAQTTSEHCVDGEDIKCEEAVAPIVREAGQEQATVQKTMGRHAVRRRYIQQKQLALTDAKALNEILMVRS